VLTLLATACSDDSEVGPAAGIEGSGATVAESRDVSGFDEVSLMGQGSVLITQGATESLIIETDDNLLQYIETEVVGSRLEIRIQELTDIDPTSSVTYRLGVSELSSVGIAGAGSISADALDTGDLEVYILGAGNIDIDNLSALYVNVFGGGAGDITLAGTATRLQVDLSAAVSFDGTDLLTPTAEITIGGSGNATVWATESLDVVNNGAGNVSYYGSPTVTSSGSGVGRLESLGDK
jgi:hypothetical protein